jgi:formate dehydrogenase major subunit
LAEITLTIDGKKVKGETGDTILDVCEKNGIDVPTLCHFKGLTDVAACRMCIVEIGEKRVAINTACTTQAGEGMVVKTNTEKLNNLRKINLELLLAERNHFCMFCEMSGDCELQDLAYKFKIDHMRYPLLFPKFPVDASHKYIVIDHNRCILCGRCVRACDELEANHTLDFRERGWQKMVNIDLNLILNESTCTSCGSCVQVCPTGAIFDRKSPYIGRSEECEFTKTVCSQCSLGCGTEIVTRSNHILRINGNFDSNINGGLLCDKGRFEPLYKEKKRYLKPMVRVNGELRESDWEEVTKIVVEKIGGMDGKDIEGLVSARATNETIDLFKKLINNVFCSENIGMLHEPVTTLKGKGSVNKILQSDLIIVLGADFSKDHKVVRSLIKRAVVKNSSSLILIDSKDNYLSSYAKLSLSKEECRKVDEGINKANKISIIYNPKISKDVEKWISKYKEQVNLIGLMPGTNSLGAYKLGINRNFKPKKAKGLYILALDEDDDILENVIEEAKKSDFVFLQTSYENILSREADVIIPSLIWAERSGSYTNLEGITQKVNRSINPPPEIKEDREIIIGIADKIGKSLL